MTGWRPEDDETVALRIPPASPGSPAGPPGVAGPPGTGAYGTDPSGVAVPDGPLPYALGPLDPSGTMRLTTVPPAGAGASGDTGSAGTGPSGAGASPGAESSEDTTRSTGTPPAEGGRAARRRAAAAARGRRGRRAAPRSAGSGSDASGAGTGARRTAPLSRVERRRAERARRPGPAVLISRAVGELFITTGVLMILFVAYQLWWTNVLAAADVNRETVQLQDDWDKGARDPGSFEPGQGFALLHIPTLDVVVPVAEGIDKERVLDRGMVGHYDEESIPTAMPGDESGNFGLAGHRNTHGEPFRYINRLKPGDPIVVETRDTYYVYRMTSILPSTSPGNISVLDPVPPGSGFTGPGRYITLTTCTPEFTSTYRMIVWGKMDEERPRDEGKPDALVDP
ncbi:class E sortase [Streptomyces sp. MJP52]|uniref:class E sortase n=2 Tax=Streptomyces TaxID=1883 RepID=UPI0024761B67|nr:class E sortase [Streptomyces sp. MJP52]MDH6226034.1 sortase A [Streptomyces sp. MJP52]